MSCDFIKDLKNFLKTFERKVIQGKNVPLITKQLHAAVVGLDEGLMRPVEIFFVFLPSAILKTSRQSSHTLVFSHCIPPL